MNAQPGSRVRSTIVKVPDATPGLLFLNGQQKQFTLDGIWKSPVAPAANMTVDVDLDGSGSIAGITVVDSQQLNKERLNQLGGVAQEKGKEAAKLAQQGIGALAGKMGAVALGATVLVWIAWFFLPAATVSLGFAGSMSFTFWNLLGIDLSNPMTLAQGTANHGALALLGLVAIAVPVAVPFVKTPWAKYLNAAPLAFLLIAVGSLYMQVHKALEPLSGMGVDVPSPFSWGWGIFVLGIAALVLAAHALKPSAA